MITEESLQLGKEAAARGEPLEAVNALYTGRITQLTTTTTGPDDIAAMLERCSTRRTPTDDKAMMRGMFLTLGQAFAVCRMVFPEKAKEWLKEMHDKVVKS